MPVLSYKIEGYFWCEGPKNILYIWEKKMIVKKRLDEAVHDKFIESLYHGKYHSGERIDPAEIASEYSISRTPVVQALKQLANEKVLTVTSGGKFYTLVPTERMINEVCDVRCLLEQHAIALYGEHPDQEVFKMLKGMICETKRRYDAGNFVESTINNREFHMSLVKEAGNQCLYEAYIPVLYQYGGIKYVLGNRWDSHKHLEEWHMRIIDCLMNGEIEEAKKATYMHIDMCREDILEYITK